MFIFLAYSGSMSDKEITKQSGYLDMMEPYIELIVQKDLTSVYNESAYIVVQP